MRSEKEVEEMRLEIDRIRRREREVISDPFKRGQLSGAQQVLWWLVGGGLDPVRAFLSDEEIWLLRSDLDVDRVVCPDCGADVPADGHCWYCENRPEGLSTD